MCMPVDLAVARFFFYNGAVIAKSEERWTSILSNMGSEDTPVFRSEACEYC